MAGLSVRSEGTDASSSVPVENLTIRIDVGEPLRPPDILRYLRVMNTENARDAVNMKTVLLECSMFEVNWDPLLLFIATKFPNVSKLSIHNGCANPTSLRGFSNVRMLTYMPESWIWDFDDNVACDDDVGLTFALQTFTYGHPNLDCKEMEPEKIEWFLQGSVLSLQRLTLTGHVLTEISFLKRFQQLEHLDMGVQEAYPELMELPACLRRLETVILRVRSDGEAEDPDLWADVRKKASLILDRYKGLEHLHSFLLEMWDLGDCHTTMAYWLA